MTAGMEILLKDNLKSLNLSTMLVNLESYIRQAKESRYDYEEFLLNLTEIELQVRHERRLKRYLREARFPLLKSLEKFDFESATDIDIRLIKELASGQYITDRRNIIFVGKSGTGKTHLATALAVEACKQGIRARFVTGCGLVNELLEARTGKTLSNLLKRYSSYELLILDELGYVPFSKEGAELLFQVLTERHEQKSLIITSNLGFADWTKIFGDANLTAALLDRVTFKAYIINCTWDSYRLKETLKNRVKINQKS
jgi:DNA replication protein DnaC